MLQLSTLALIGAGLWCWPGKCHLCLITCTMNHFYFIASPLQYESFACCPFQPLWLSVDHIVLRMLIKTETSHSSLLLGMLVIPTYFNGWRGDTFWGPLLQFHCRLFSSFLLQRPDFTPDSRSRICADHFAPDSFTNYGQFLSGYADRYVHNVNSYRHWTRTSFYYDWKGRWLLSTICWPVVTFINHHGVNCGTKSGNYNVSNSNYHYVITLDSIIHQFLCVKIKMQGLKLL